MVTVTRLSELTSPMMCVVQHRLSKVEKYGANMKVANLVWSLRASIVKGIYCRAFLGPFGHQVLPSLKHIPQAIFADSFLRSFE